ncbi:MAG: hypothetical protein ABR575_00250 [Actinomycetota bacterium]
MARDSYNPGAGVRDVPVTELFRPTIKESAEVGVFNTIGKASEVFTKLAERIENLPDGPDKDMALLHLRTCYVHVAAAIGANELTNWS